MMRGQILPIFGLLLVVLMGMAALAVDVGYWRYQQRVEQSAADSAAIAGAAELNYAVANDWSTAAANDASANGYTSDGGVTVSVVANHPPATGPYAGNVNAVEVIVSKKQPLFFGGGIGFTSPWVSARAVAVEISGATRNCMYALSTSGSAIAIAGGTLNAPQCGISSNSGLSMNGASVTAANIGYVTSLSGGGSSYPSAQPMITVPQVDPCPAVIGCAYLAANEPTGSCLTPTSYNGGSSATIAAGHYCTTLQISGVNNVTFSPGVYRFDNGLSINGGSSVTGNGVTFYDPGGSIAISGVSSLSLTAPASGNTIGILMYQPPSNTSAFGFGGGGNGLAGMLYFPTSNVSLNGALSKWFFVIANTVSINGGTISVASSSFPSTVSHAVLGE